MCNLYAMTKDQVAIRQLFTVTRDTTGNLPSQAFSRKIKKPNAVGVKPSLAAEIEYRAKSAEGKLRHPIFKGFREDL